MAKKETFSRFDATEYLKTEEDMALYLDAIIEESNGDPRMIAVALGDIAKARGMTQIAKDTGLARENLYKALSADGKAPTGRIFSTLTRCSQPSPKYALDRRQTRIALAALDLGNVLRPRDGVVSRL